MRTSFITSFLYGAATFHAVKGSIISIAVPQTIGVNEEFTIIFYNSNEQAYYQPVATIFGFDSSGLLSNSQIGGYEGGISFLDPVPPYGYVNRTFVIPDEYNDGSSWDATITAATFTVAGLSGYIGYNTFKGNVTLGISTSAEYVELVSTGIQTK